MKTNFLPKHQFRECLKFLIFVIFIATSLRSYAQTYAVMNASSTPGANGIYTETGTYNSAPYYSNGSYSIFRANQNMRWAIISNGSGFVASDNAQSPYAYSNVNDGSVPPVRAWHHGGNTTGLPGEYIIVAPLNSIGCSKHFFIESLNNDGSIKDTILMYLYADGITLTGTDGDDFVAGGKVTITNLPAGLSAKVERLNDSVIIAFLEGLAAEHNMKDNIDTLRITFENAAVSNNDISAIDHSSIDFKLLFQNPYTVEGTSSNTGAVGVYMLEGMFNENPYYRNGNYYLMTKGCYPTWIIRTGDNVHPLYSTQLEYQWPINRQWHNGGFYFHIEDDVVISMQNSVVYGAYSFIESEADDGSFTDSIQITYHMPAEGSTFSGTAGEDFVSGGKITVSNVPAGLSAVISKFNDTVLYARLTGQETEHEVIHNIDNLKIEFEEEAFSGDGIFATQAIVVDSLNIVHMQKYVIVDTTNYSKNSNGVYSPYDMINGNIAYANEKDHFLVYRNAGSCMWSVLSLGRQNAIYSTDVDESSPPDSAWRHGDWDGTVPARIEVFPVQPWLGYYDLLFVESEESPGSIENSISVVLHNGTDIVFSGDANEDFIQTGKAEILNVPDGLTAVITKTNDTLLHIELLNEATQHSSEDNINNIIVKFDNDAFNASAEEIKFTEEYNIRIQYKDITEIEVMKKKDNDIIIGPNPAKDFLYIENVSDVETGDVSFTLIDLTGNIVKSGTLKNNKIDISSFTSGIYFLRIERTHRTFTKKLIFQ